MSKNGRKIVGSAVIGLGWIILFAMVLNVYTDVPNRGWGSDDRPPVFAGDE